MHFLVYEIDYVLNQSYTFFHDEFDCFVFGIAYHASAFLMTGDHRCTELDSLQIAMTAYL